MMRLDHKNTYILNEYNTLVGDCNITATNALPEGLKLMVLQFIVLWDSNLQQAYHILQYSNKA